MFTAFTPSVVSARPVGMSLTEAVYTPSRLGWNMNADSPSSDSGSEVADPEAWPGSPAKL